MHTQRENQTSKPPMEKSQVGRPEDNPFSDSFERLSISAPRSSSHHATSSALPVPTSSEVEGSVDNGLPALPEAADLSSLGFVSTQYPILSNLVQKPLLDDSSYSNGDCLHHYEQYTRAKHHDLSPGNCFQADTLDQSSYLENRGYDCRSFPAHTLFSSYGASLSQENHGGFYYDDVGKNPFLQTSNDSSFAKLPISYHGKMGFLGQNQYRWLQTSSSRINGGCNREGDSMRQIVGSSSRGLRYPIKELNSMSRKPFLGALLSEGGSRNSEVKLLRNNSFLGMSSGTSQHHNAEVDLRVVSPLYHQLKALLLKERMDPLLAMKPDSSECLKDLLDNEDLVIRRNILSGVLSAVHAIMKDPNGYQVFNKIIDVSKNNEKEMLVLRITQDDGKLVKVAKHNIGIRSAKKLMKSIKRFSHLCELVTSALFSGTLELMVDPIGSHFIDHCFQDLGYDQCVFLYAIALQNFHRLARDQKGCLTIKNCINYSRQPYRELILSEVIENSSGLARDPYGNYIVQSALALHDPEVTTGICSKIKEDLVELSTQKYGSYVVQACLRSSAQDELLRALVRCSVEELERLVQNPYGNYVFQTAVEVPKDEELHAALNNAVNLLPERVWYSLGAQYVVSSLKRFPTTRAGSSKGL